MKSSGKAFTGSIVMSMILIASVVSLASAGSPTPPMAVYGALTIDGSPAAAGTIVVGYANDVDKTVDSPHVTGTAGEYGYLQIDCTDGEALTFRVNGQLADHNPAVCSRGTVVQIDLAIGEPQGECTPGQTRQCGTTDVGECEYGTETCSPEGYWGACTGAVYPAPEICDGLDNDCDGSADENWPELGTACIEGIGACESAGLMVCSPTHDGTECSAVPGAPGTETCNNIDDDCNGVVDDGLYRSCGVTDVGLCTYGLETCSAGSWGGCDAVMPTAEVCTGGLDEDCDGYTDCADSNCATHPACETQEEYCLQILSIKVLNNDFNEDYYIMPGEMYNVEIVTYNDCEDPVESMQIVQVDKIGNTPVNIGTVKSTISPYSTSTVTVGFVLPGVGMGTQFEASAYNWNHWISQSPGTWEALSAPASVGFEAGTGPI